MSVHLILYSKPGCHLCEGLQEKLEQIQTLDLNLEVRDITTRDDWFQAYQYEIPVLVLERRQEANFGVSAQSNAGRRQKVGEAGEAEGAGEATDVREDAETRGYGDTETKAIQNSKLKTQNFLHPSSLISLPRPSPRATVQQLEQMLRKYL